ncbi:MAG: class I SAM-dependent methyltransferase [Solirubrobacterales bacterium]
MDRLRRLLRQLFAALDRERFPEANDPRDHWQRLAMNEAIAAKISSLGPVELTAAEISGNAHRERGWRDYAELAYPDFDLAAPLPEHDTFDVVVCEQVLEHVADPWLAVANLRDLTTPGGTVIVSTPFLIRVHELPRYGMRDYWRFTPRGLRTLLESAGLDVESVDSWGNRDCLRGNLDRWSARRPWHSMRNEPELPLQVWAFATNPG